MTAVNAAISKVDILSSSLINLRRIKSDKTKDYLLKHKLSNLEDLGKILPVCYLEGITQDFNLHSKSYEFGQDLETVWNGYLNIPPAMSWCGRRISFSFSYDTNLKDIRYIDDEYKGLKENQLIFIEIKILFGLIKLAVTHQVNTISKDKHTIKLCYVEGGKSSGSQIISFEKAGTGTKVTHNTWYKSDSKFRDKFLYPIIHERIINHFHKNVRKYLS